MQVREASRRFRARKRAGDVEVKSRISQLDEELAESQRHLAVANQMAAMWQHRYESGAMASLGGSQHASPSSSVAAMQAELTALRGLIGSKDREIVALRDNVRKTALARGPTAGVNGGGGGGFAYIWGLDGVFRKL